ncbi:MAG: TIGR03862 family flavoprotein [Filomicrobium sp.]
MHEVAVIGGGPAGLMAAEVLSNSGVAVTVFERMPSVGRKLLMAGRGGLNLTHSEGLAEFLQRYGEGADALRGPIEALPPKALRSWSEELGEETFVGSSGRVFPVSMKASPLLRAWLARLNRHGVEIVTRARWVGWDRDGSLRFDTSDGALKEKPDAAILALGGGSWSRLGSDGGWVDILVRQGLTVAPLRAANCGFIADWSAFFREKFQGKPLKRIGLTFGHLKVRGEAVVTALGIEGSAVYALSAPLREEIAESGKAILYVDLRPDFTVTEITQALSQERGKQSMSTYLRKVLRLSPVAIGLLQEAAVSEQMPDRLTGLEVPKLAALIKSVPVKLVGTQPIDQAISTAGGVAFKELDHRLMLRRRPGVFVAGEMLDWEAPTGGYLLQGCFATGAAAGRGVLEWLAETRAPVEPAQ